MHGGGTKSTNDFEVKSPFEPPSSAGQPPGPASQGGLFFVFFGYFLLAAQQKVTSRRATPGELEAQHQP
jgi:hypothetical protein